MFSAIKGIGEAKMDWPLRLKVALGAAKGLAYLHSGSDVGIPIVHRDFKSTNILLDTNFEAKVIWGWFVLFIIFLYFCLFSNYCGT